MRYEIGDKVRVVSKPTFNFNDEERMDHWLNKVVTIKGTTGTGQKYRIEEDQGEHHGSGWAWEDDDFVGLANPNPYVPLSMLKAILAKPAPLKNIKKLVKTLEGV